MAGDAAAPFGAIELRAMRVEDVYGVTTVEVLRARQAMAWSEGRALSEVTTEDVMRTGPGVTGWARSYDSSRASAGEAAPAHAPTEYEEAYAARRFDAVVAITRRLVGAVPSGGGGGGAASAGSSSGDAAVGATADASGEGDASGKGGEGSAAAADASPPPPADPKAAFYLARCIEGGVGCDDDAAAAEPLFRAAVLMLTPLAVAGDPSAQFALGECFYNGSGVDEDERLGLMWYKSAALAGHPEAQWAAKAFGLL